MSFIYGKFLIPLIILIVIGFYFSVRQEKKYFSWVKKFWFYKRSRINGLSSIFFYCGLLAVLLSTLDLRGPEETITGDIPDQKTLILIDSSASMLAEDVRPNRYEKALVLARHFVKKAIGHQISLALFSDTTIPASPFTDDISFLDAKLGSLSAMNLRRGGTSLVQSINEAVQILKVHSGGRDASGNILIFTDSEDHGHMDQLNVPASVNVALVGVGTVAGGRIPIKTKSGEFLHYKKYKGQEIITKLNESKIKNLGGSIVNFRYWVALSYSVPTEEITRFFKSQFKKTLSKGEVKIRPVLAMWLMVPGILLLGVSFALSFPATFVCFLLVAAVSSGTSNLMAEEVQENVKEVPPTVLELKLMNKSKLGNANSSEKLKLAEELFKANKLNPSLTLYEENLKESSSDEAYVNYGAALLKSGSKLKGVMVLNQIRQKLESDGGNGELLEVIRKNIKQSFQLNKKQKKKEQQKKDKKDDKKEKKRKDKKEDNKKKQGPKDKKDQSKDQKKNKGEQKKDQNSKKKEQKKEQKDGKEKKSKPKDKEQKKKKKSKDPLKQLEAKEQKIKQQRKMKKIPSVMKQLMDEDKNIMKKLLDTSSPKSAGDKKDW